MSDERTAVVEYISERFAQEDFLLNNILADQEAGGGPMMNIGPDQGKFLNLLIKIHKPKRILEVGSYFGYSSIWMGRAARDIDAQLVCVEKSAEQVEIIRNYIEQDQLTNNMQIIAASGVDQMQKFIDADKSFDMVFIDADKGNYSNYLDLAAQLLPQGGLVLVDNTIWYGKVADQNFEDNTTQSIRDFNDKLAQDERFESVIVTVQDGLAMGLKK